MQEWAFVGRSEPISHVRRLIDDGRSVVIRGDAGSGKSRMLWELGQRIEESGVVPVRLVATATAASIPLAALAPLLTVEAHGLEPLDILARGHH